MSVESDLFTGNTVSRVHSLLSNHPALRDDDKRLYLHYLVKYCGLREQVRGHKDPFQGVVNVILNPNTPMFESVSRCRRKLQEQYAFLRGKHYKLKQESAENIRQNI